MKSVCEIDDSKNIYCQDVFPCLPVEQVQHLLEETNGNVNEAAEMAIESLNGTFTMPSLDDRWMGTRNQFTTSPSVAVRNRMISGCCSTGSSSLLAEQK